MKKILVNIGMLLLLTMLPAIVYAATGEWWEVTAKMEMEGMPFAMPAQTSKVCLPKGGESDPRYTQGKDSDCKMTDVKQSGNTVKFKGTCVRQGETMNMVGETSHSAGSFKSNVKMSGKSRGENVNMTMVSNGKRIGGSCDPEAAGKQAEAMGKKAQAQASMQISAACETSRLKTIDLIGNASLYLGAKPVCPGKREVLCKAVRSDGPRDVKVFETLKLYESAKESGSDIAKSCNVNLNAMQKSLCKEKAKRGPLDFLEKYCPAEAKTFREIMRKQQDCEGRGFTGINYKADMKKCMGGEMIQTESTEEAHPGNTGSDAESGNSGSGAATSEAVREGTKALKGLFGF